MRTCGIVSAALLVVVGIIGAGVMAAGKDKQNEAAAMAPEKDFAKKDSYCTIKGAYWRQENVENGNNKGEKNNEINLHDCYERFRFSFEEGSKPGTERRAKEWSRKRCGDCTCESLPKPTLELIKVGWKGDKLYNVKAGTNPGLPFYVDDTRDCWMPTSTDVPSGYSCGDPTSCWKLFDPQDDKDAQALEGGVLLGVGIGLLVVGLLGAVSILCCLRQWSQCHAQTKPVVYNNNNKSQANPTPTNGVPMAAPVPTQQQMQVQIPVGMTAGMMMQVQTPSGGVVQVTIPAGMIGGQNMTVMV